MEARMPVALKRVGSFLVATLLALGAPAHAQAPAQGEVEVCASASESAQSRWLEQKLRAAREQLLVCARPSCPGPIKRDCDQLLSQVDAAMPSIVIAVKDGQGRDVADANVWLDGVAMPGALDGRPVPVDPGQHTLRIQRGTEVDERQVLARAGEKQRAVDVRLPSPPAAAAARAAPPVTEHTTVPTAGPPWPVFALGGVGVAALAAFGYLAISGQSDFDACSNQKCTRDDLDALDRKRAVAWTALGVGVAASAASVVILLTSSRSRDHAARSIRLGVRPEAGGAVLGAHARF